jgi:hypothetical protein
MTTRTATFYDNIYLVYYIYVNRKAQWREIITGQLTDLQAYKLLQRVNVYIHITDSSGRFDEVLSIIDTYCPDANVSTSVGNRYEYPALKLIFDLAHRFPDAILIYLHTKGMSHHLQSRMPEEVVLLSGTFQNWEEYIQVFEDKKIKKIGMFPADDDPEVTRFYGMKRGWMWINFWYARADYIIENCEAPRLGTNRWYFEVWLSGPIRGIPLVHDCYSLYGGKDKTYFNVQEMQEGMEILKSRLSE